MSENSSIEWTDATWTPVRARVKMDAREIAEAKGYTSLLPIIKPGKVGPHCVHSSPGCERCYSETNNGRCLPHNGTGLPFDKRAADLVDIFLDEKILLQPLGWRAPKRIFVCSQTDLCADFVPDWMIERVFAVAALRREHTFLFLTKRADRMAKFCLNEDNQVSTWMAEDVLLQQTAGVGTVGSRWPLPNCHMGFSAENQEYFDSRWQHMRKLAAAGWMTWCSYEPALGPVDASIALREGLRWLVAGAESGHGARPCEEGWIRSIKNQCVESGVAFFYKQAALRGRKIPTPELDGRKWTDYPQITA